MRLFGMVALAGGLLLWFTPIQLTLQFRQHAWTATIWVEVKAPLIRFAKAINLTAMVSQAVEGALDRWRTRGEPISREGGRRAPHPQLMRAVRRPLRYLGRRIRWTRLAVWAEVGGFDAMQSALLVGMSYAAIGSAIGLVSQYVNLRAHRPRVHVRPNFTSPSFRVAVDCILRMRLGHLTYTGLWVLRRAVADRQLRAWVRESWRRKGVAGGGRTSDPRVDEDRHGEPERHG